MGLVIWLTAPSASAQSTSWRSLRIDGSSQADFEASVVSLQNELPRRRREDFETALAAIWVNETVGSGDVDHDGDTDVDDLRILKDDAVDLLTRIERGDLLPAIQEREKKEHEYTAADYIKRLDGLRYDEVLSLADLPESRKAYLDDLNQRTRERLCAQPRVPSATRLKLCDEPFNGRPGTPIIKAATGRTLNTAIEALNAKDYARARTAIASLNLDRLSPYEHSKVEQILFSISYGEGNYAEARDHLLMAIDAGGLTAEEVSAVYGQIRFLDSRLSESPP